MFGGVICAPLPPPPQLGIAAPQKISAVMRRNGYSDSARRVRAAESKILSRKKAPIAAGSQFDSHGSLKDISGVTFPMPLFEVVVTVTITLSGVLALEFVTYLFNGSFVLIAQLALGALVLQAK